ncbi:MAG TPA: hypothetical protein VGN14_08585 [Candidatus Elarobacter sp.]|jgi:hypothetical protein
MHDDIRPRTIGELFDRTVHLIVRRWRAAATIGLIGAVPLTAGFLLDAGVWKSPDAGARLLIFVIGTVANVLVATALAMLYAGDEERPKAGRLLAEALRRFGGLLLVGFVCGFTSMLLIVPIGFAFFIGALFASAMGTVGAAVVGGVCAVAAAIFLFAPIFASQIAFYIAITERAGVGESLSLAFRRVMRGRARSSLLAAAIGAAYLGPLYVIGAVGVLLGQLKLPWLAVAVSLIATLLSLVVFNALMTLASLDYRMRTEGTDLLAAIETPAAG